MKFGALTACESCRYMPDTEDDALYSLAFTEHYFDQAKLNDISQSIRHGTMHRLPQQQEDMLRPMARDYMRQLGTIARSRNASSQPSQVSPPVSPPAQGNDEIKQYLVKMLSDMRNEFTFNDLQNPTIRRLYEFTGRYVEFVVNGGTDQQSDWLSRELEWMKSSPKIPVPPQVFDSMRRLMLAETPRYKQRVLDFMQAHFAYTMHGQGDPRSLLREVASLKKEGVITEDTAASFERSLKETDETGAADRIRRLAAGEDPDKVYGSKRREMSATAKIGLTVLLFVVGAGVNGALKDLYGPGQHRAIWMTLIGVAIVMLWWPRGKAS
jgi:hypothetical protein